MQVIDVWICMGCAFLSEDTVHVVVPEHEASTCILQSSLHRVT